MLKLFKNNKIISHEDIMRIIELNNTYERELKFVNDQLTHKNIVIQEFLNNVDFIYILIIDENDKVYLYSKNILNLLNLEHDITGEDYKTILNCIHLDINKIDDKNTFIKCVLNDMAFMVHEIKTEKRKIFCLVEMTHDE
jgi:hypothetical protein